MSTTTSDSTIHGKVDEVVGKVKQGVGEAIHDEGLANRGAAQQVKGHGEQAWGSVKEAVTDKTAEQKVKHENDAHDVREKITSTAQNVKEKIQNTVDPDHKHAA